MQATATSAWLARAQGKNDEAKTLGRQAADLEDVIGKHPISPGAIIPARELLARPEIADVLRIGYREVSRARESP